MTYACPLAMEACFLDQDRHAIRSALETLEEKTCLQFREDLSIDDSRIRFPESARALLFAYTSKSRF